jgi:translation initiation factor IF-1
VNTAAAAVTVAAAAVAIATNRFEISRRGSGEPDSAFLFFEFVPFPAVDLPAMKEEHIEVEGSVTTVLPGTMFRVELDNKHLVLATICGKMRKRWVRLTVGDRVKMEMSPYDLNKARITWRLTTSPRRRAPWAPSLNGFHPSSR